MANFPQSFEPVNSDSILEQFLQLKGNVNKVNTAMVDVEQTADSAFEKSSNNESSIQVLENNVQTLSTGLETAEQNLSKCVRFDVQSLTDEQKAQARSNIGAGSAMATTVLVNGVAQTQIQFDSDPQTQIDSAKSEISALNSRVETAESEISALDGKALKTPMTAPTENEIPTINTENSQVNVTVGNGLKIETNELKVDNNIIQDKLTAGNGISIENNVISRIPLYKDGFNYGSSSKITTTNTTLLTNISIEKVLNNSSIVVNFNCPLTDNSNGYKSFIFIKIDNNEPANGRSGRNSSGMYCLNKVISGLPAGSHTIGFWIGCGAGSASVPAYEEYNATIMEVL